MSGLPNAFLMWLPAPAQGRPLDGIQKTLHHHYTLKMDLVSRNGIIRKTL
jgi:hypothetical protein